MPALRPGDIAAAIAVGDAFLHGSDTTPPYEDYYRVILRELGVEPLAPAANGWSTGMTCPRSPISVPPPR